jgi:hypothetical protein
MRFGKQNVRSLYRARSLTTAAREIANYESGLVQVQMVNMSRNSAVSMMTGYGLDDRGD